MNPKIEVNIIDSEGFQSDKIFDWSCTPYELYINGDLVNLEQLEQFEYLKEMVKGLQIETLRFRALCTNMFEEFVKTFGDLDTINEYVDRLKELGVEVS